jgi:N-methylhydantoinase A
MAGFDQVITFDMGGTSTDVSLCPGHIQETTEGTIAGLPLRLPMIDVHTVGAGGGSIARQDTGSALLVGPQSAGVDPGPVCYGQDHAEDITVTDANLSLGRIHPEHFLGGRMILDTARTEARMLELARRLSLPMEAAAWGVIRVANSNIERAIRTISVERGYDPRYFTLVAFGGAGPLHACELAQALWIQRVLIPVHPGVLSALGMVMADTVKDYSQTVMLPAETVGTEALGRLFIPLYERTHSELMAEGLTTDDLTLEPALDMRYVGQSYELTIPFTQQSTDLRETAEGGHIRQFHAAHRRRFSYATEGEPVEIVNLRLKAIGRTDKPRFLHLSAGNLDPSPAKIGYRQVFFGDVDSPAAARPFPAARYERDRLTAGNVVVGPAIIHQLDTTTAIPPGWAATVDGWCNLVIERRGS